MLTLIVAICAKTILFIVIGVTWYSFVGVNLLDTVGGHFFVVDAVR